MTRVRSSLAVVRWLVAAVVVAGLLLGVGPAAHADRAGKARTSSKDIGALQSKLLEYQQKGKYYPALRAAKKILAHHEKARGKKHPDTVRALQDVGRMYWIVGNYVRAIRIGQRALRLLEQTKGPEHMETLSARDALAAVYWAKQDFARADGMYKKSMAVYARVHGEGSRMHQMSRTRYAAFLQSSHRYSDAEAIFLGLRDAMAADKTGKRDSELAGIWMQLAHLHGTQGDNGRAIAAMERALGLYEKMMGKRVLAERMSPTMLHAAQMYQRWGDQKRADKLLDDVEDGLRADVAAKERSGEHWQLRSALQNLATLHVRRAQWKDAEKLYARLLAMDEKQWGKGNMASTHFLYQLAEVQREQGKHKAAARLLSRYLRSFDKNSSGWAKIAPAMQLAQIYREQGDFQRAYKHSKKIYAEARKMFGDTHPTVQFFNEQIALLDMVRGKGKRALKVLARSYEREAARIALILAAGTEKDNRTYLSQRSYQMHLAIALHDRYLPKNKDAAELALGTVLVRKGRLLDAAAGSVATLRKKMNKGDRELLDELAAVRAQLSKLVLAGPDATGEGEYARELARLESEVRTLERKVRKRSAAFRAQAQLVDVRAVQKAIPRDAVLIEIVAYHPFDPRARSLVIKNRTRYGAYVLGRKGAPQWTDLGPAPRIDDAVNKLREALASPDSDDVVARSKALHRLVIKPLAGMSDRRVKHLLVAPDGALNLVPFAALADDRGQYLIRRYGVTYLTSGRDLLRLAIQSRAKQGTVIIADPEFDKEIADPAKDGDEAGKAGSDEAGKAGSDKADDPAADPGDARTRGRRSRDLRSTKWERLPGTAGEARAIAREFRRARMLRGDKATEQALKGIRAPRILHLATHGFFLPPQRAGDDADDAAFAPPGMAGGAGAGANPAGQGAGPENPLLRSGLVLAGANRLASGSEDGVLTALEASGLDLWGTELVVLSACETGVGTVSQGEGVYGLRRALTIAGAESLVMSLWQVDDEATKDLMTSYYKRLKAGKGRSDALRLAQLRLLESSEHDHPYYWAAFIPAGAWAPLSR